MRDRDSLYLAPLTQADAVNILVAFVKWSDHPYDHMRRMTNPELGKELPKMGIDVDALIKEIGVDFRRSIPRFENLLDGSGWNISGDGPGTVAQLIDGVEIWKIDSDGDSSTPISYDEHFLSACKSRDQTIKEVCFDSFNTALGKVFASIEGFLALRAFIHNAKCAPEKNVSDKRENGRGFLSFDDKLRVWVPAMTGHSLDLSGKGFAAFRDLRQLRDDVVVHPKPGAGLTTATQLADALNKFKRGPAELLFMLHVWFGLHVPATVIRATFFPEVRVRKAAPN